jgi:ABC-2 type transport system ATP-binding protein
MNRHEPQHRRRPRSYPDPPRHGNASISLRGLGRDFGDTIAVDALTFDVEAGALFGIVGPDGAGKTTTLRMLAGVLRPSRGTALVGGVDVAVEPEKVKPHTAYMAQRFGLYEDLTVAENLDFYADLYRVPRSDRRARLERLHGFSGLGPFQHRLAGQLSGGMKQKLSLSCCLIHRPEVLLLDEPTFGVDPISRRELWMILHEMVSEGVTVVLSTSYLDEAERCDRVAMLDQGKVLALDDPAALQRSLEGSLWAIRTERPRAARDVLRARLGEGHASLFGVVVHAVASRGTSADQLQRMLQAEGIDVVGVEPADPTLEDVFIGLVQDGRTAADA